MVGADHDALTDKEQGLVQLLASGLSNKEIAERLNLSPYTVRDEVSAVLRKLGLRTRVDLVRWWLESSEGSTDQIQPSASIPTIVGRTSWGPLRRLKGWKRQRLLVLGVVVLMVGGLGTGLAFLAGWSPFPSSQAQWTSVCEKALPWFAEICDREEAAAPPGTFSVAASTWHQHRDYPVAGSGGQEGEIVIYTHPRYGYIGEVFLEPESQRQIRATGTVEPIVVPLTTQDVRLLTLEREEQLTQAKLTFINAWLDKVRKGQVPRISHRAACWEIAC